MSLPAELTAALGRLIDGALAQPGWPPRATTRPRALLVHGSSALYAYYLDEHGGVHELDLDRMRSTLEPVTDREVIRATYAAAASAFPELAALADACNNGS